MWPIMHFFLGLVHVQCTFQTSFKGEECLNHDYEPWDCFMNNS